MNALRCFIESEENGFLTDEETLESQRQPDGVHSESSSGNCGASSPARASEGRVMSRADVAMKRALALVTAAKQSEQRRQEMFNCGV